MEYRQWAIDMVSFYVTPYIPLLFVPIPFSATLEIMSIFLLVLVVIIPTVMGGWNAFSDTRIEEVITDCPSQENICIPYFRKFITSSAFATSFHASLNFLILLFQGYWALGPVLFLCALSITIMIASYFAERSNRKSFIQKKQLQVRADAYTVHAEVSLLLICSNSFLSHPHRFLQGRGRKHW